MNGPNPNNPFTNGRFSSSRLFIFDYRTINMLLDIAWWDWSNDKITAHLDAITQNNLDVQPKI